MDKLGVTPPPGLPPGLMPPPGLAGLTSPLPAGACSSTAYSHSIPSSPPRTPDRGDGFADGFGGVGCQVHIGGLHNRLLSDAMMEAMLEQAGVEDMVLSFAATAGHICGEARVHFAHPSAAARFTAHVNGRRWGS